MLLLDQRFRRRGLGHSVFDVVIAEVRDRTARPNIMWLVHQSNEPMLKLSRGVHGIDEFRDGDHSVFVIATSLDADEQ